MKELFQDIHSDSIMTFLRPFKQNLIAIFKIMFVLHLYQTIIQIF